MDRSVEVIKLQIDGTERRMLLQPRPYTLDDATRLLPGGAYTTFRTYRGHFVLRLANHWSRLRETAVLAGKPVTFSESRARAVLRRMAEAYPSEEMRLRVVLDLELAPGDVYLLCEALSVPPPEAYEKGVAVVTRTLQRSNPKAKLTGFIEESRSLRQSLPTGVNEALMVSEAGGVLEGLSSNFFGVLDGEVWTAEEGVLSGITRAVTLDLIRQAGFPLRLEALPVGKLPALSEAWITSSSRAVLPVTVLDGIPVGDGFPGPVTRALRAAYLEHIEDGLEAL